MFEKLAEYNFWKGEKIEVGFSRQAYIDRLSPFLGNALVKIVLGQRRTGKSYVLRMLMRNLIEEQHVPPQNILYVNMDIQTLRFIRDSQMLMEALGEYRKQLKPSGKVYVFLDEVQRYDIKGRRLLAGERKYYLNDLAFKSQLMSGANPSAGRMLENIVYLHYRREGYRIHTGRVGQGEIDFVLQEGDEVRYAQVCYLLGNDRVAEREFGNLERTGDNYPKTVISMDEIGIGNVRGISHVRAWEL